MSTIRYELVYSALHNAYALIDDNKSMVEQYKFVKQAILNDESLTKNEKLEAKNLLKNDFDYGKILYNEGKSRICKNCQQECLAVSYCEYCIRNYLKSKFSSWTSGNNDIDNLIQECQSESRAPDSIVEWIPYNNLRDINYLSEGGYSKIYTADWIDGQYYGWDSTEQRLTRHGTIKVVLKRLENIEGANRSWFDEACKSKNVLKIKIIIKL
jgi:hypothetical protein